MFKIDTEAEQYIADLFAQQEDKTLALKIDVTKPGTPVATVGFNFCFPKDLTSTHQKFTYNGFNAYIDEVNFSYLEDSVVELKQEGSQQKLTIFAPNSKGESPKDDAPLSERIDYVLAAEINPQLAQHGGFAELIEITDDHSVVLNFGGGCQGCSSVKITLKNGVESQLKSKFPEIKQILDATDHNNKENAYM